MKPPFLSLSKNITKKNTQREREREQCRSSILHPPPFSFSPAGIYTLSLSHLVFFSLSMCIERSLLDLINNSCRPKVPVQYNSLSLGPHRIDFLVRFFLSVTFFFISNGSAVLEKHFFLLQGSNTCSFSYLISGEVAKGGDKWRKISSSCGRRIKQPTDVIWSSKLNKTDGRLNTRDHGK